MEKASGVKAEGPLATSLSTEAGGLTLAGGSPLLALFRRLHAAYGPQSWWPAETAFEMIAGAYLTQNTNWRNVELALTNLKAAGRLSVEGIRSLPIEELEQLVRPSGFFRQKALRLKAFAGFLEAAFHGDLGALLAMPTATLREHLLALPGVGRETADSILLYAAQRPVFVIDLYTRRLLFAEGIFPDALTVGYDELRERVESSFSLAFPDEAERTRMFNEFHALIVVGGKVSRRSPASSRR